MKVIVVFDAHQVPGVGATYKQHKLTVVYTKEKETADECIERLVIELTARRPKHLCRDVGPVEQHVAFGKGALRMSARELQIEISRTVKRFRRIVMRRRRNEIRLMESA